MAGDEWYLEINWNTAEYFVIATDREGNSAKSEAVRVEAVWNLLNGTCRMNLSS